MSRSAENPFSTAQRFLERHNLPLAYLDQVADFITKNTAGETLGGGEEYVDPYTGKYSSPLVILSAGQCTDCLLHCARRFALPQLRSVGPEHGPDSCGPVHRGGGVHAPSARSRVVGLPGPVHGRVSLRARRPGSRAAAPDARGGSHDEHPAGGEHDWLLLRLYVGC